MKILVLMILWLQLTGAMTCSCKRNGTYVIFPDSKAFQLEKVKFEDTVCLCCYGKKDTSNIIFKRDDQAVCEDANDGYTCVQETGVASLKIDHVTEEDTGSWTCGGKYETSDAVELVAKNTSTRRPTEEQTTSPAKTTTIINVQTTSTSTSETQPSVSNFNLLFVILPIVCILILLLVTVFLVFYFRRRTKHPKPTADIELDVYDEPPTDISHNTSVISDGTSTPPAAPRSHGPSAAHYTGLINPVNPTPVPSLQLSSVDINVMTTLSRNIQAILMAGYGMEQQCPVSELDSVDSEGQGATGYQCPTHDIDNCLPDDYEFIPEVDTGDTELGDPDEASETGQDAIDESQSVYFRSTESETGEHTSPDSTNDYLTPRFEEINYNGHN